MGARAAAGGIEGWEEAVADTGVGWEAGRWVEVVVGREAELSWEVVW